MLYDTGLCGLRYPACAQKQSVCTSLLVRSGTTDDLQRNMFVVGWQQRVYLQQRQATLDEALGTKRGKILATAIRAT